MPAVTVVRRFCRCNRVELDRQQTGKLKTSVCRLQSRLGPSRIASSKHAAEHIRECCAVHVFLATIFNGHQWSTSRHLTRPLHRDSLSKTATHKSSTDLTLAHQSKAGLLAPSCVSGVRSIAPIANTISNQASIVLVAGSTSITRNVFARSSARILPAASRVMGQEVRRKREGRKARRSKTEEEKVAVGATKQQGSRLVSR